ncbi:MAG TPA: S8 family serine peptidase [Panacibacter sp.]|nr:S8 family serine peptidase [Panacibacter sp.]HNP43103.1 S8 family serine peptidase [Panacibacter sp.]
MQRLKLLPLATALFITQLTFAQSGVKGWHMGDAQTDHFNGISIDKAYTFLNGKPYKPVIVAVIDSGVDTAHEDLKDILWINTKEIPGNGIDDDHNGYVDDIHGWNFLGNSDGNNLNKANDERSRVYYHFKDKFSTSNLDTSAFTEDEKWQYNEWVKASGQMNIDPDEKMQVQMLDVICRSLKKNDQVIRAEMNKDEYTQDELEKFQPETSKGKQAKMGYITCLKMLNDVEDQTNKSLISDLEDYVEGKKREIDNKLNRPPDYRAQVIKDNYYDINDRYYGNNDIMGPDPMHGTHVSGIIAAVRNNNIGVNGVADHVKIMMIRAIPDGDEYDKDIALAIKYAVDNGATVINMSFGKSFSPEKKWVDEAVRYAELKDVLIVRAAGNESHNTDSVDVFPNAYLMAYHTKATNFLSVGASGDADVAKGEIVADFSNYGKATVDVFAPGIKIYSTLPGHNQYGFLNGTSMAAPVVTGIAALIRSYYPALSAKQVIYAIDKSAEAYADTLAVTVPGTEKPSNMHALSISGGVVNAYQAVEIAAGLKPEPSDSRNPKKVKPTLVKPKENN